MKHWSLNFRLWHWINAIVIFGLLGTVFLRKTFLSYRTNSEIIMDKLSDINITIAKDQAISIARAVRSPMWDWHIWLGYALAALVVWRIVLFFTDSGKQNYQNCSEKTTHDKIVSALYVIFYALMFLMAGTGLALHFHDFLHIGEDLGHSIKEFHELLYNGILYFVIIHIAGVIIAENKGDKGIISSMVGKSETNI
ncbi:MAG: cytochrome b/b6 domain-containing protein [Campylobacterales bacterium]|nr:cytochrome b/b6 domain-containing protein [Campylobacterales bacterium]